MNIIYQVNPFVYINGYRGFLVKDLFFQKVSKMTQNSLKSTKNFYVVMGKYNSEDRLYRRVELSGKFITKFRIRKIFELHNFVLHALLHVLMYTFRTFQ